MEDYREITIQISQGRYEGLLLRIELPEGAHRIKIKTQILEEATQVIPCTELPEYTYLELFDEARN